MAENSKEVMEKAGGDFPSPNLKKYRQAGIGFVVLNLIDLTVWMRFLGMIGSSEWFYVGGGSCLVLLGVLAFYIYRGKRGLVTVLAVIYAGRSVFSMYSLIFWKPFPGVPYGLPALLLTFYVLGRAAWDWP